MHFFYVLYESNVQLRKSESTYLGRLKNKYVSDMSSSVLYMRSTSLDL